jgi:phage gpG-like protein
MLKNLINKLKNIQQIPKRIGFVVLDHTNENFRKQAFDGTPWQLRKDKDTSRNLLVQSGRLRRSIRLVDASFKRIVVASDLNYAKIHNEGGKIPVTAKMRKFFWARYYTSGKKSHWKALALTSKKQLIIPKRQFLGVDRSLQNKINQEFTSFFSKIFQ